MGLVLVALAVGLYFVPTIVAYRRLHPNRTTIFVVNLLAGWTVLGWLGALLWSMSRKRVPQYR